MLKLLLKDGCTFVLFMYTRDVYYYNIVMKTIKEGRQIVGERRSSSCSVSEKEEEEREERGGE